MNRLIFIEGVSGVGKSTAAVALSEKLRSLGFSANCYLEGDTSNPIDLFNVACLTQDEYDVLLREHCERRREIARNSIHLSSYVLVRYADSERYFFDSPIYENLQKRELSYRQTSSISLTRYSKVFIELWQRFAADEYDFTVFDGSLLHHPINDLIRNHHASVDEIIAHLTALLQTIQALNPIVFYLSTQNVVKQLQQACISRGQKPRTTEQMAFWQERQKVDSAVLGKLPVEAYSFDITHGEWESATEQMLTHVLANGGYHNDPRRNH
jgi:hypothetical protein